VGTPFMQSCSVPVWMMVFPKVPPMPTHMAENVLFWEMVTWGTVQEPLTPVIMGWGLLKSDAAVYPPQFRSVDWLGWRLLMVLVTVVKLMLGLRLVVWWVMLKAMG
jgi:hypothetical protein